jgi:antitoxin Phd
MDWTITDKDQQFTKIAGKALHEKRQRVQTEEGVVVVISEEELDRIEGNSGDFIEHLLSIPKGDIEFPRDKSPMREVEW